jgi:hypothetical protein
MKVRQTLSTSISPHDQHLSSGLRPVKLTHDVRPNTRELEGVDSQICRTFLWSESDILGGICPT